MGQEKLVDLTPTTVSYIQGERPSHIKLTGAEQQSEEAFEFLEYAIGDAYGTSGNVPTNWVNNLSRDIGDRDKSGPLHQPGESIENYVQTLTADQTEHELDLVPIGTGATIIGSSTDASVVPAQYQNTPADLTAVGDWTIAGGLDENGVQRNSRKLVTFSPSDGGTITFDEVTTGHGDGYVGSSPNVYPRVAQAEDGGPFCTVVLEDEIENIYSIVLPLDETCFNRLGESSDISLSNTVPSVGAGYQMKFPEYFFDTNGLDLETTDGGSGVGKIYPLGLVRVYDWDTRRLVNELIQVQAAEILGERRYKILVQFEPSTILDAMSGSYMVVCSGTTLSEQVGKLTREFYNHKHDGDDLVRHLSHSSLMGLRTGGVDSSISDWYGPSNIDNNDHSMYLHRDGFDLGDEGGGYNLMRGTLLIGSTTSGGTVPNYNLDSDTFSLQFGTAAGPKLFFDDSDNLLRLDTISDLGIEVVSFKEVAAPAQLAGHVRLYAKTDKDLFYKNSDGTEFLINRGHIPLGGIIGIAANLTGAYTIPASGTVSAEGYMVLDGSAIPGGNSLSGTLPDATDSRFFMGSTVAGSTGGNNSSAHTHSVPAHYHDHNLDASGGSHSHTILGDVDPGSSGFPCSSDTNLTTTVTTASSSGSHSHSITGDVGNQGGVDGDSSMTSGAASVSENRPLYLTCVYIIRVK